MTSRCRSWLEEEARRVRPRALRRGARAAREPDALMEYGRAAKSRGHRQGRGLPHRRRAGRPPVRAWRDRHRGHRRARRRGAQALRPRRPLQGQVRDPGRRGRRRPSPASASRRRRGQDPGRCAARGRRARSGGRGVQARVARRSGRPARRAGACRGGGAVGGRRAQGAQVVLSVASLARAAGVSGSSVRWTRTRHRACGESGPACGSYRRDDEDEDPLDGAVNCFGCRFRRWAQDGFTCLKGLLAE